MVQEKQCYLDIVATIGELASIRGLTAPGTTIFGTSTFSFLPSTLIATINSHSLAHSPELSQNFMTLKPVLYGGGGVVVL